MKRTKKYYENLNKIIKCDEERKNDLLYKYYVYKNSKSFTDDLLKQVVKKLFDIKSKQEKIKEIKNDGLNIISELIEKTSKDIVNNNRIIQKLENSGLNDVETTEEAMEMSQ